MGLRPGATYKRVPFPFASGGICDVLEQVPGQQHDVFLDNGEEVAQVSEVPGGVGPDGVGDADFGPDDFESEVVFLL